MDKRSFDFKRTDHFLCDPYTHLRIIGGRVLHADQQGALDTDEDPHHPLWDLRLRDELTEAFVNNIDAFGIQQPIVIAKLDDVATVVAGRRRVRAARIVCTRRLARGEPVLMVPCVIKRVKEAGALLAAMISENEARVDDDSLGKLAKLRRLIDRGCSPSDAATIFAVDERTIEAWLRFDELATDEVKQAVEGRRLSMSAGAELAKLKDPVAQHEALAAALVAAPAGGKVSAAKVKRAARAIVAPGTNGAITSRRTITKLRAAAIDKRLNLNERTNTSPETIAWWKGVEAALNAIVGDEQPDARLAKIIEDLG